MVNNYMQPVGLLDPCLPVSRSFAPYFPLFLDVVYVRHILTCRALCQVEKVVLSFLGKQGELARRLLNARRQQGRWETDEIPTFQNGTANAMEEEGDSKVFLSCFDCSQDRSLRSVFCSIGREIAELMQSLQLNGKSLVTLIC